MALPDTILTVADLALMVAFADKTMLALVERGLRDPGRGPFPEYVSAHYEVDPHALSRGITTIHAIAVLEDGRTGEVHLHFAVPHKQPRANDWGITPDTFAVLAGELGIPFAEDFADRVVRDGERAR